MTQEVLKLALEALEYWDVHGKLHQPTEEAITAIKEALAKEKTLQTLHSENERLGLYKEAYAQPEQESVADDFFRMIADRNPKPFPSPQRTWVGLTGEERGYLYASWRFGNTAATVMALIQHVEDKLKDKNS